MGPDVVAHPLGHEVGHGVLDEDVPDHRRGLDHRPLLRVEVVEARGEQRLDGGRHDRAVDVRLRAPLPVREADEPLVDEHRHELLDEERVALGRLDDAGPDALVEAGLAEQVLGDRARLVLAEAPELDPHVARARGPLRQALDELVAGRADEEERRVLGRVHDVLDEVEEGRLRPVDVLEEDDERPWSRERLEQPAGAPGELLARELRRHEADRRRDALLRVGVPGERRQLLERHLRRVALEDPSRLPHRLGERPEGDAVAVGQAATAEEAPVRHPARCTNSSMRRDFPTPASPTTVTSRQRRSATAPSSAPRRLSSSSSRPTIGASMRRGRSAPSRTATSRYAGTGSDFPLSSSGSTSSTSTKSRTRR